MLSMTGYGKGVFSSDGVDYTVEIKSVNHRFFDFTAKYPRMYAFLEEKLKKYLTGKILRGKIDAYVTIAYTQSSGAEVKIDEALAESYYTALGDCAKRIGAENDITMSDIARFQDIFLPRNDERDAETVWAGVRNAADIALCGFNEMRSAEGEKLKEDVISTLFEIEKTLGEIEKLAPPRIEAYKKRLSDKLFEILSDRQIEESRVLTETAIFADKVAIDEETVRLHSHIGQFRDTVSCDGAVGKKLDFLIQEFNREANTIGSKCQDAEITKLVVSLKCSIEKIREQIQNIE